LAALIAATRPQDPPSLPGLIRQSILFARLDPKKMDPRITSEGDDRGWATAESQST
jgi:hypothetical protein